jgi:hypothetical protein
MICGYKIPRIVDIWMSNAGSTISWIGGAAALLLLGWYCLSLVFGGVLIIRDEIRLRRSAPRADDVRTYADQMEALHGQEAFRVNGEPCTRHERVVTLIGTASFGRLRPSWLTA